MTRLEHEHQRIGEQIQRAAAELPDGYNITINLEKGAGSVDLTDPDYEDVKFDSDMVDGISYVIESAIDAAINHSKNNLRNKKFVL